MLLYNMFKQLKIIIPIHLLINNFIQHKEKVNIRLVQKFQQRFRELNIQQFRLLFYSPTHQANQPLRIDLRILQPDQHQSILNANYNNENEGLGTGENSFYNKIAT